MRTPGVLLVEWVVVLVVAVSALLTYASELGGSELGAFASIVLLTAALAAVVPLLVGASAINALWRSKTLSAVGGSRQPLTFVKSGSLADDVSKLCHAIEKRSVDVPFHGSLLASRDGVEIWGGPALSPRHILTIPYPELSRASIVTGSIGLQNGQFLALESRSHGLEVKLQLVGGGPLGLFGPKAQLVRRIAESWGDPEWSGE